MKHFSVAAGIVASINAYRRAISPLMAPRCRFRPSCSEYAAQAVARHGTLQGLSLAVWRLLKCHPFHPGGFDPVPKKYSLRDIYRGAAHGCRQEGRP